MPELTLHCWSGAVAIKVHHVQQDYVTLSQCTCEDDGVSSDESITGWKRFISEIKQINFFIVKTQFAAYNLAKTFKSDCLSGSMERMNMK